MPIVQLHRRRISSMIAIVVALAAFIASTPGRALAGPSEGDFFSAANSVRASAGLPAYTYAGDLAAAARAQATRMAASGTLAHNPDLGGSVSNWQGLAENVGVGPDWQSIQRALMESPEHRGAILDPGYTQMGVGTAVDRDGTLWVAEVFRLPAGSAAPAPQPPASSGSTAPTSTGGSPPVEATSSSSPTASPSIAAPAPSPTEILRDKIKSARDEVASRAKGGAAGDPLVAAIDYSTVMDTVA